MNIDMYDLGFGTDTRCLCSGQFVCPNSHCVYQNRTYFLNNPEQYPRKLLFLTYHQIGNSTSNCIIMKKEKYK